MGNIRRLSIRDQIYEEIRDRILKQEYEPGTPVNILQLTKEFGVSNTPIREALNMLVVEGLLTSNVNNKFKVISLDEKTVDEINDMLLVLLCGGYRIARDRGYAVRLPGMLKSAYESQIAARVKHHDEPIEINNEYIRATMAFDRCFVEVSGNSKMISAYENCENLLYMSVRRTYWSSEDAIERNLEEHREIIAAVEEGDEERIIETLKKHYDKNYAKEKVTK